MEEPSNTFTMTVLNTGTAGSLFTVGLFNAGWTPGMFDLVSATRNDRTVGNDNANWGEGTQSLNGSLDWGVVKANSATAALGVGAKIVFVLTFNPDFTIMTTRGWRGMQAPCKSPRSASRVTPVTRHVPS